MAAMSKINSLNKDSLFEVFEQLRKKILKEREETERARATEARATAARLRVMRINDLRSLEIHNRQLVLPHYTMRNGW